jgi:glyoxylase-like metal-dependent hydrolase (beta-lactamase superfamily II)
MRLPVIHPTALPPLSAIFRDVTTIASGTSLFDLEYPGQAEIATCFLETSDGLAVVDPGPASTFPRFQDGLRALGATLDDVRIVLVTHIHLDHAGATGWVTEANPRCKVYAHALGTPHLVDPGKLIRSATRIFGEENMLRLWGEVKPVPPDRIVSLSGGETLKFGARVIEAAYTPGHAWHHMAWFDRGTGIAFTGEVVGEHVGMSEVAIPATPPPDIDVELLIASGDRIMEWQPERLFLTHFGPVNHPDRFVREHAMRLVLWSERVRASLAEDGTDEEKAQRCCLMSMQDLEAALPKELHAAIEVEAIYVNWFGLARYWRKKQAG